MQAQTGNEAVDTKEGGKGHSNVQHGKIKSGELKIYNKIKVDRQQLTDDDPALASWASRIDTSNTRDLTLYFVFCGGDVAQCPP